MESFTLPCHLARLCLIEQRKRAAPTTDPSRKRARAATSAQGFDILGVDRARTVAALSHNSAASHDQSPRLCPVKDPIRQLSPWPGVSVGLRIAQAQPPFTQTDKTARTELTSRPRQKCLQSRRSMSWDTTPPAANRFGLTGCSRCSLIATGRFASAAPKPRCRAAHLSRYSFRRQDASPSRPPDADAFPSAYRRSRKS